VSQSAGFGHGGRVGKINDAIGEPTNPLCGDDPLAGLGAILGTPGEPNDGLFPGVSIPVDTSRPGTYLFQCMIHPWMRTILTVE
jgi:hypothetical protein